MAKKVVKKAVKKAKKVVKKTVKKEKKIAKNPAKKKIIKKTSIQKRVGTKKMVRKKRVLVIATEDRCFWVSYGPALRNLLELRDTLHGINEEQFKHHVNNAKNDFADWVRDVLEDKKTSLQIKKTKTINSMLKIVEKALKDYQV